MSSDSSQSNRANRKSPQNKNNKKKNNFGSKNNENDLISFQLNSSSSQQQYKQYNQQNSPRNIMSNNTSLQEENKKLRRKLKQLSQRLDEQLERAAENKLKMQNLAKFNHPVKQQTTNLELQNAYKMIQRLQKSVKDFQNKQSYQISVKRIMDLESIIKKKQSQVQELKQQIKTNKKIIREKDKHINELLQNSKKNHNVTQDKELIERMKKKLKKITQDNDMLRKKQLNKHQQLVKAERKIVQMEQDEELPIGREEVLVKQLEDFKRKYKEAMQRIEKQNLYITRLNERLDKEALYSSQNKARKSQSDKDRRNVSKSLEELPAININKFKPTNLLEHIPSPKVPIKLKRY